MHRLCLETLPAAQKLRQGAAEPRYCRFKSFDLHRKLTQNRREIPVLLFIKLSMVSQTPCDTSGY